MDSELFVDLPNNLLADISCYCPSDSGQCKTPNERCCSKCPYKDSCDFFRGTEK